METMEEYKVVRIINEEPEFFEAEKVNLSAEFFILCEEDNFLFGKNIYNLQIAGMSLLNWVVRVCGKQPKILKVQKGIEPLDAVRNYIDYDSEYSVVFYADTPLISKNHLNDLLAFVDRKRMNVCRLKRGLAFRNDYIKENDEIYSIDEYDFASDDFFVVNSSENFEYAKTVLTKKVISYHRERGVYFENENTISIDANTEIGENVKIFSGASVVEGSKIGSGATIHKNAIIAGSTVGSNSVVGANSVVEKSIVKDNAKIGKLAFIKNSVVGNNVLVDDLSSAILSSVRDGAVVKNNVRMEDCRIGENSIIQSYSKILGLTEKTIIGSGSDIGANSEIVDSIISSESIVDNCSKINDRVER